MFASKGNLYSKMFIYLIKEDKEFTSKSLENKLLQELIKLRIKYKIQILILLTHADTYCNIVKADGNEKWKETCKMNSKCSSGTFNYKMSGFHILSCG